MILGPDATRYLHMANGARVSRPFYLRWLLPTMCKKRKWRWWAAWAVGWALAAVGMFGWMTAPGKSWQTAAGAMALLLGLPGFLGPTITIPVGVDIPATGLALCGVWLCELGWWEAGIGVITMSAMIRESTPVWTAIWLWSPWPLVALVAPVVASIVRRPGPDPLGPTFQYIADHPVRAALDAHQGRWRDAWLMVAPWGVCVFALISPTVPLVVVLVLAYAQLLVATDTVRLVHHAAGPAVAAAAAAHVPESWMLLAVVVHVVWWRTPERI